MFWQNGGLSESGANWKGAPDGWSAKINVKNVKLVKIRFIILKTYESLKKDHLCCRNYHYPEHDRDGQPENHSSKKRIHRPYPLKI
jgi:hypothetical protein